MSAAAHGVDASNAHRGGGSGLVRQQLQHFQQAHSSRADDGAPRLLTSADELHHLGARGNPAGALQQLGSTTTTVSGLASGLRPLQLTKPSLPGNPRAPPARGDAYSVARPDQADKGMRSCGVTEAGAAAVPHEQHTQPAAADASMVKQPVLVRDLLRAVQGLKGSTTRFAEGALTGSSPGLLLAGAEQARITEGHRTLMHEMGELGVLYRRVQAAIAEGQRPGSGSVRQALCGALYEEVTDFLRLMAVLEAQLPVPQPKPGDDADASAGYLTLRRLQLYLAEPLRRMRLLAALVDASAGCVGGDLAGRVWAASAVGDPLARSYATRILHQVCVPLFGMIRRWVFEGGLEDAACEFFIVEAAAAVVEAAAPRNGSGARNLWRDTYRLELAKLPPFISQDLALTILRAGKSINFLRDACGDKGWVQEWAPAAAGAAAELGYGQLPVLERVVVSASASVDARLMAVLRSTGEWDRHCQAIRRYLLLGQGDFVVALLDKLGDLLATSATLANQHETSAAHLNHLLRQALASCAGGACDEAGGLQDRLRVEVVPRLGSGECGWETFSLSYHLGAPLNAVFTPDAQRKYNTLARLLWRLRRAERSLNNAWHTLKTKVERCVRDFRGDPCSDGVRSVLRAALRQHAEMAHLTTNLQYYINLEVVECAWSEFTSAAAAAPDLDCLIAAHDKFLQSALDRALLGAGSKAQALQGTVKQLLDNCMALEPAVNLFEAQVRRGKQLLEERAQSKTANTAAGGWGGSGLDAVGPVVSLRELGDRSDTLADIAAAHSQHLTAFLHALPAAANEVNAEVRFLRARLDFSGFYTAQ